MNKKIICIILIIAILEYFCTFVFAENSLTNTVTNEIASDTIDGQTEELRKQNEEMNNKINETNEKLEYVKEELSDTMLKVQETEDKVLEYEKQVKELGQKMSELQSSIDVATANLEIASQDYDAKSDMLAQRLVAMYEAGDTSYLDVLLKSSSLTDFLSRYYAIEELTKYDSELIDRVEKEKNNIEQTREKLEAEQAEIKIVKAKSEQTTVVLNNMKTLQQSYVERLSAGEKTLQEQFQALYIKQNAEVIAQEKAALQAQYQSDEIDDNLAAFAAAVKESEVSDGSVISGDSEIGNKIANMALSRRGSPYVYGACHSMSEIANPNQSRFDCSGLVNWAFYQSGVNIGSNSTKTLANKGVSVSRSSMQAGDIILFSSNGSAKWSRI